MENEQRPRSSLRVLAERAGPTTTALNGIGIAALTALHLWGKLPAEWAGLGILALCGIWLSKGLRR